MGFVRFLLLGLFGLTFCSEAARAQQGSFDPSWYDPDRVYVKIATTEDDLYQVTGEALAAVLAQRGLSLSAVDPTSLLLLENGHPVPFWFTGTDPDAVRPGDALVFRGRRNRGDDEAWAYLNNPSLQSSTFYSLYSDTTFYWLTWGGMPGPRYERTDPNVALPGLQDVSASMHVVHLEEDLTYYDGDGDDAENPAYTRGEGYYWARISHTNANPIQQNRTFTLTNLADGDSVYLSVRLNSITATRHRVLLEVETLRDGAAAFHTYDEADWNGYAFQTLTAAIPVEHVPANRVLRVRVTSVNDFNANPNILYLDWLQARYRRDIAFTTGSLAFAAPGTGAYRFHLKNAGEAPVLVVNERDGRLFELQPAAGAAAFNDRPSGDVTYWAAPANALRQPAALALDASSNWADAANEADYVVLTTAFLRPTAEALAQYRAQHDGYATAVVDVRDVFDQFDYGRPTPLAIRRFVHQTQQWRRPPQFLMLLGDALYPERKRALSPWEMPSYGKASSDGWFAMQMNGPNDFSEVLAIGRVPIRTNEMGQLFLQKLQTYEAAPPDAWQKDALFLVGGYTPSEQQRLQQYSLNWSRNVAGPPSGLNPKHFFKNAQEPVDPSFRDSLRLALRSGASWLSYFGHSAPATWEIVTDPPAAYDNANRLPIALSLGCRTGAFAGGSNLLADTPVLAEQLVVGSLNGAILHWGSSGLGSISGSVALGNHVHRLVFQDTLRVMGKVFQEAKRLHAASSSSLLKDLLQFGLLGDPATRYNLPVQPEFSMSPEQITIMPPAPIPADSLLSISAEIRNFGLMPADSASVQLTHRSPAGQATTLTARIPPFALSETTTFSIPLNAELVGPNVFEIHVDPENAYAEVDEHNNAVTRTHVVFSTGLHVVSPQHLSTTSTLPRLRVTLQSEQVVGTPILFQLDDDPAFTSPEEYATTASGIAIDWQLTRALEPGRVYYWRAKIVDPDEPDNWRTAAFTVAADASERHTWLQQGPLFVENTHDARLTFQNDAWSFRPFAVEVQTASERGNGQFKGNFRVDGQVYESLGLGFGLLILDGVTGEIRAHGSMPTYPNTFEAPELARAELDSLVGLVNDGDYVFVRTRHLGRAPADVEIPEDIKDLFRGLGSQAIDTLTYADLWIMVARKGDPAVWEQVEPAGPDFTNEIVRDTVFYFQRPEGATTSPPIGPARSWTRLGASTRLENADSDVRVDVLDAHSGEVLMENLDLRQPASLGAVDAALHPTLRLRATLVDSSQRTTPQLLRWYVDFTPTTETALDPLRLALSADTLQEAEPLELTAVVRNLGDAASDTLFLTVTLTDARNQAQVVAVDTLYALAPDSSARRTFPLPTRGLAGRNQVEVHLVQAGQPEPLSYNNTLLTSFFVERDRVPPQHEVYIDGLSLPHDPNPVSNLQDPALPFVSGRPEIEVVIRDENTYQFLQDTTLAILTLDGRRISFADPNVQFTPATPDRNEARIVFTPDLTGRDSTHTLVVRTFDASGNEAANSPYQTHFRVQSAIQIESLYPYPNPMSNHTTFAFRLRGADPSMIEDLRIRIFTINGRLVREFDLVDDPMHLEGGMLRIGWNKLSWDVRDDDGDLLGTGVYLYKVYLRSEGESLEVNNARGVEKLVVIR